MSTMVRYVFFLLSLTVASCATLPKSYQTTDEVIAVGPGPEDMVVDTITEEPRILISCNSRRDNEKEYGEIEVFYTGSGARKVLKRVNEPDSLFFNPHGIDLVELSPRYPSATKSLVLLVVNHDHRQKTNAILRYHVLKDELVFINQIIDPLISSPNAVTGFTDGTLLVSNDARKAGNIWEPLLVLKRARIVYWDGQQCSVAAEKFCYSNGIAVRGQKVYLASTRQNKVWQFDFDSGRMINKEVIAKVKGGDNIRFDGENLLVPCHLRFTAFLKHLKDSSKYSPSTVYRINPQSKTTEVIYYDSGKQLSASSTAVTYRGYLYVSGVFDPKIVRKKINP